MYGCGVLIDSEMTVPCKVVNLHWLPASGCPLGRVSKSGNV